MTEKKEQIKLIKTEDGSHSLYVPSLNETYHSFHGAVQESKHVFLKMGLDHLLSMSDKNAFNIFEVGFGTGLNALLAAEYADNHQKAFHMTSIEAYPITLEIAEQLNYLEYIKHAAAKEWFEKMHTCTWQADELIHDNFTLKKIHQKLEECTLPIEKFDIIFFDAFAPNKQEELWTTEILKKITNSMNSNGVFVTYCAKGQLKRDLATLGLEVSTLPGPPGKKEMVRAVKA